MSDLVVASTSLDDLAVRIRSEHTLAQEALERGLRHAIRLGELLAEAKQQFSRANDFDVWVNENLPFSTTSVGRWVRLAHYQDVLPEGIKSSEATAFLRGLPTVRGGRNNVDPYPEAIVDEARRRRSTGETYRSISEGLGINMGTVARWCLGRAARRSAADLARMRRQRDKLARREAMRDQALQAARDRGGNISKAYSHLRKLSQELDMASSVTSDKQERKELRVALSKVLEAETHLSTALGVNYGSWRN